MSLQLVLLDRFLRLALKRRLRKNPDVLGLRPFLRATARLGLALPRRVERRTVDLGGVATERLTSRAADRSRAILYLHGGGMVAGSPAGYRSLTWRLADGVGAPVFVPDYRLAPEHPFPAALDDVTAAYRALLAGGTAAASIAVAGDSAGGNLTFALALELRRLGLPQPACLVGLSPATDLFATFESFASNAGTDAAFDPRMFGTVIRHYCPGAEPGDPRIAPLRGELAGLPPTLIQCGRGEMLRDASLQMAEKLRRAGVDVRLEVWPDVFHVWHLAADVLPEARRAIARVVGFVRGNLFAR